MDDLKNIFKGVILGVSNIIPVVSAGTMAVILGIYNKIIDSVSGVLRNFKENFRFLFFIGIGILGGIIFFSNILEEFLKKYPWQMNYLFMGLIAGSIGILFKTAISYNPKKSYYIYFIITLLILVIMRFISPPIDSKIIVSLNFKNIIFLMLSGFVASSAMILPGVSGSFVLVLFGMYNSIISAISNFNIIVLIPFGIGVILGLIIMIKIIGYLLKNFKAQTYMGIVGLVVGSIFSIFPGFEFSILGISCIVVFLIGFLISFCICKINVKNVKQD